MFGRLALCPLLVTGPSGRWSRRTALVVFLTLSGLTLIAGALGASSLYALTHPGTGLTGSFEQLQRSLSFLERLFDSELMGSLGQLFIIAIVSIWGACAVWMAEHGMRRLRKLWSELPRAGGVFLSEPCLVLLEDGRRAQLTSDFGFQDCRGKVWLAPAGTIVDGASIPRFFWRTFGPPFVGQYRNASIIHDFYCESRTAPSSEVHRMFFEACLAGGLSARKAKLAYWAVRRFGPYWGDEAEDFYPGQLPDNRPPRPENPAGLPQMLRHI